MKIFAIYLKPLLTQKPSWFDAFYQKHGGGFELHVTLKQSCFIEEDELPDMYKKLTEVMQEIQISSHSIPIIFDQLVLPDTLEGCVMINAQENKILDNLQKKIVTSLKNYTCYTAPELEQYEKNFIPHITIAQEIKGLSYDFEKLKKDCVCKGEIRDITLIHVKEQTLQEAQDLKNKTLFTL